MKYRLSLNVGSTFLGWCALEIKAHKPVGVLDMGVRVFGDGRDPQTGEGLALIRTEARQKRRNRHRRKQRQKRLLRFMIEAGLMPTRKGDRKRLEELNPWALRAKALDEEIPLYHLGRALLHISKRRGFRNLRLITDEERAGSLKAGIRDLEATLIATGSRTLGEYLWQKHQQGLPVRVRARILASRAIYNFFTERSMYRQEVDAILAAQRQYHHQLTDEVCDALRDIIFFQHPLRPPPLRLCRLESGEPCAPLAFPLVQKFYILRTVNELAMDDPDQPPLAQHERETIVAALLSSKSLTFGGIRKMLRRKGRFNLESSKRLNLPGDSTSVLLADDRRFGTRWREFSEADQEEIIRLLLNQSDAEVLKNALMNDWGLSPDQADYIDSIPVSRDGWSAGIREGFAHFSIKAIRRIMPWLEHGYSFIEAAHRADYRPSERPVAKFDRLPYYGQVLPDSVIGGTYDDWHSPLPEKYYGRVNNPSLHIAFNQLRKLVNAVIDAHGRPDEIVVSIARSLKEPGRDIVRKQARNRRDRERIATRLAALNVESSYRNRLLYALWEDLAEQPELRCCPFSGAPIAESEIFSGKFEECHLLPFSRSYDDRRFNMILCSREWSRRKASKTPFEAFGHRADWPQIEGRVCNLPEERQWRFAKNAASRMEGRHDVRARLLDDENHKAQWACRYLRALFQLDNTDRVRVLPGQLTPLLRHEWGLNDVLGNNARETEDHRFRAVDALILGCTDAGLLRSLAETARAVEEDDSLRVRPHQLVRALPEPFTDFRRLLSELLGKVVVSYKPDHGGVNRAIAAARPYTLDLLHRQTAYGRVTKPQTGATAFATRVPADSIMRISDIEDVADAAIRRGLLAAVRGTQEGGPEWRQALASALAPGGIMKNGIRTLRLHMERTEGTLAGIYHPGENERPFKYYEIPSNYCAEIFCSDKGDKAGQWQCEVISTFHAHQKDFIPAWRRTYPTAKLVMRLWQDDMVAYENGADLMICKVKKLGKGRYGGLVYLRLHSIAEEVASRLTWEASASQLQLKNARKLSVDIMGRVKDPGRVNMQAQAA